MEFVLRGRVYRLTKEEVEVKMREVEPEPVRKHYVVINGRKYPVKQVIEACLGIPRLDFTTQQARRILSRLGFELGFRA